MGRDRAREGGGGGPRGGVATGPPGARGWAARLRVAGVLGALVACGPSEVARLEHASPDPAVLADHDAPIGPEVHVPFAAFEGTIERRDTLSVALARFDVGAAAVDELVLALSGVFDFRRSRVGHRFFAHKDEAGRLTWFRYVAGPATIALAFRGSDGVLRGMLEHVDVVTTTALVEGRISSSLYEAMSAAGESPALVLSFVDLFAWDVDFFTETQAGDTFRILVEKRFVDGELIGYGRTLAAEYAMSAGRRHRAFLFEREDGTSSYYTETGESVRKAFLKSPIQFASITSRYGLRRHPILQYVGTHRGVDYAAPIGTAVWAVGDGVISAAGPAKGYGNMVTISHANGLQTRYAHLRGFATGISRGRRVTQKQVIGYVGMTGLTTGPHLHFEVLRGGQWMNPLSVAVPPAPPIAPEERELFDRAIAPALAELDPGRLVALTSTQTEGRVGVIGATPGAFGR